MSSILSLEHCARATTWDEARRKLQKTRKIASRTKLACFVGFNVGIWTLFLMPILLR